MAYGTNTNISYLGAMAAGAMEDGTGFTPGVDEIIALTKAVASGLIQKGATARQAVNIPNEDIVDKLCFRDISGSGAFTGTAPEIYTSTIGAGFLMDRLAAHTTLMFGSSPIEMAQTFFISQGLVSTSKTLAPTLSKLNDGVDFGKFPNLESLVYPADGKFPNFLGEGYPDYQSVVTNGISTLVTNATVANFQLLASDITNLGTAFDVSNIADLGNPGQVVAGLNTADAMTATGLDVTLAQVGIDPATIYNLGNETYNDLMQIVLDSVTSTELISNAQALLGTNIDDMTSLGDYTNFDKIFKNSKDIITFSTMAEFRTKLQAIELGRIETLSQLATYINTVEPATLPTISNRTQFTRTEYIDSLIAKFLGGTGLFGAITLTDMIGSLGGVGIDGPATTYREAMARMSAAGEFVSLSAHLDQLAQGLAGDFTSGSGASTKVTDPDGPDITDSNPYIQFQLNKIEQIETDCANLMSRRNVNPDIQIAIDNWLLISKKIFDEKDFQTRIDMGFSIRTSFSEAAFSFISGLRGTIDEDEKLEIINGMVNQAVANGDIGGEYVRAYIKELENKEKADNFDIRWRAEFDE